MTSTDIKLGILISKDVDIDLDQVKSYSMELGLDPSFISGIDLKVRYNIIYIQYNKNALFVVTITDKNTNIITLKKYEKLSTDDICGLIKEARDKYFIKKENENVPEIL